MRDWRDVVSSIPAFWSTIFLHKTTTVRSLRTWIARSGTLPLSVGLYLHRDASISPPDLLWRELHCALERIRVLAISAFDEQSLAAALSSLRGSNSNALSALTVYAGISARKLNLDSTSITPSIMPSSSITFLRAHGVRLEWPDGWSWISLTSLVLIDRACIMTWKDFQNLSVGAVNLTRLGMREIGCTAFPNEPLQPIIFPSVAEFSLVFGGGASGTVLLEHFEMPRLSRFRFHGGHPDKLMILSFSPRLLSSVRTVALSGITDLTFYSLFFVRLPLLESLEMLGYDYAVLRGLRDADLRMAREPGFPRVACPRLSRIGILDATARDIRRFLEHRGNQLPDVMPELLCVGTDRMPWAEEDLIWIRSRANVELCGQKTEDPNWMSGHHQYLVEGYQ
ncbi:hypothetical protein C8R47DRAFT_1240271 [Mycena vitilis]|nr:hypothetical protein C8R47DRAFT_1240271 [Mycena vitilis]